MEFERVRSETKRRSGEWRSGKWKHSRTEHLLSLFRLDLVTSLDTSSKKRVLIFNSFELSYDANIKHINMFKLRYSIDVSLSLRDLPNRSETSMSEIYSSNFS